MQAPRALAKTRLQANVAEAVDVLWASDQRSPDFPQVRLVLTQGQGQKRRGSLHIQRSGNNFTLTIRPQGSPDFRIFTYDRGSNTFQYIFKDEQSRQRAELNEVYSQPHSSDDLNAKQVMVVSGTGLPLSYLPTTVANRGVVPAPNPTRRQACTSP